MTVSSSSILLFFFILSLLCASSFHGGVVVADLSQDSQALLGFLHGLSGASRAINWSNSTNPCTWLGVQCSEAQSHVTAVKLPGSGLTGSIKNNTLGMLSHLQVLSLRSNQLSGHLPHDLTNCTQLKKLVLRKNKLSGPIPGFSNMSNPLLSVIDLAYNGFSGSIPASFPSLTHLKILYLQNNSLSSAIPASLGAISQFSVANNSLTGSIPDKLRKLHNSSFSGNVDLCGPPLSRKCPSPPPPPPVKKTPLPPPSNNSSNHTNEAVAHHKKIHLSKLAIIIIIAASAALLFFISAVFMVYYYIRQCSNSEDMKEEKKVASSKDREFAKAVGELDDGKDEYSSAQEPESNKLVFFHGGQVSFDLEDLLRASAEVLGKGTFGTSYKAVLEEGPTVVVKRLKDSSVSRKEFEQQMDSAGKMRHRNLVPMRAYYYSKEEKLLVHEYLPLGNLSMAIHGTKSTVEDALDWETRLRVAAGAARGLAYLHSKGGPKYVHGDVKPSNVLLHRDYGGCISDYGLATLFLGAGATLVVARMPPGYRAPEIVHTRRLSQKSDVYSFGVVLLELLTARAPAQTSAEQGMDLPKWVQSVVREEWTSEVFDHALIKSHHPIEEEMVQLLQIALACVSHSPDQRPSMPEVLKMITDIRPSLLASFSSHSGANGNGAFEEDYEEDSTTSSSTATPPNATPPNAAVAVSADQNLASAQSGPDAAPSSSEASTKNSDSVNDAEPCAQTTSSPKSSTSPPMPTEVAVLTVSDAPNIDDSVPKQDASTSVALSPKTPSPAHSP